VAESNWVNDKTLTGSLDELRVYNRELTAAEVKTLHEMAN
jgi:hypothetical protein